MSSIRLLPCRTDYGLSSPGVGVRGRQSAVDNMPRGITSVSVFSCRAEPGFCSQGFGGGRRGQEQATHCLLPDRGRPRDGSCCAEWQQREAVQGPHTDVRTPVEVRGAFLSFWIKDFEQSSGVNVFLQEATTNLGRICCNKSQGSSLYRE
jgi:hypothetical protein